MNKNVGTIDKIVRIVLGIILLALFFLLDGGMKYISLLGIVLLFTAFINFCPIYKMIGISTKK